MTRVAFALMHSRAIPARVRLYEDVIAPALDREGVVYSTHMDANNTLGIWRNCLHAWHYLARQDCTHGLVMSDDMLPCSGFRAKLDEFIARHPGRVLCIFQPASSPFEVVEAKMTAGVDFEIPEAWIAWGGSIVIPRSLILDVVAMADQFIFSSMLDMDDARLTHACLTLGLPIWNIHTSLISHVGAMFESHCDKTPPSPEYVRYRMGYSFAGVAH